MSAPQHNSSMPAVPALRIESWLISPAEVAPDYRDALLAHPDCHCVWISGSDFMLGLGEVARLEFNGLDRFAQLRNWMQQLESQAEIDDQAQVRGSGLNAFSSFTFSADSQVPSLAVVPRTLIGKWGEFAFITHCAPLDLVPAAWPSLSSFYAVSDSAGLSSTDTDRSDAVSLARINEDARITFTPAEDAEGYARKVNSALNLMTEENAKLRKVVLSTRMQADFSHPVALNTVVKNLAAAYPTTWVFRLDDRLGASPEMLLQTHERTAFSRVLAGTLRDGTGSTTAFLRDDKELNEHRYAIDSVTAALLPLCSGLDYSAEPFLLKLPGLTHLASDVSAQLQSGVDTLTALEALHPSAAVCGTPRALATETIADLERADRGHFAGPVGWLNANGDSEWAIALRTARFTSDVSAVLYAGGGLVPGSVPGNEFAEVVAKMQPVKTALQKALIQSL